MNLLFLTNVYPNPYQPNKGIFNRELIRALSCNHQVRIVSPISWIDEWQARRSGAEPLAADRQATLNGLSAVYPRYYYPPRVLRSRYGWFFRRSIRGCVRRLLETFRPDAVVGYWAHPDGEAAVHVARELGVPSIVMVGGSDLLLLARKGSRRRCIARALEQADAVVTTSKNLKERAADLGVAARKIHMVPRGVDLSRFKPGDRGAARQRLGLPPDVPVLIWAGRMVPVKGLDVLLESCSRLRSRQVDFRLFLIGGGALRSSLEAECQARKLDEYITFVGPVTHDRLGDWYRAANLAVLPSRSEGIPNVLREAQACGLPFVASRVGGIPELAVEPIDRLVPPENPEALAEAIAISLQDGRNSAAKHLPAPLSWAESAERLLSVLQPLVRQPVKAAAPRVVLASR